MNVRLSQFIREEMEPILQDWDEFAKTILHASHMNTSGLRDHAKNMLLAFAEDLDSCQSDSEQAAKSKGYASEDGEETWAEVHGGDRHTSGSNTMEIVSEFRALRAIVVSHWTNAYPVVTGKTA